MTTSPPPLAQPRAEVPEQRGRRGTRSLVVLMVLAVAAVAALSFWDERRESAAALEDFADEQTTLAGSVASELATRLAAVGSTRAPVPVELLEGASRVERPGVVRILLLGPDDARLRGTDGRVIDCP